MTHHGPPLRGGPEQQAPMTWIRSSAPKYIAPPARAIPALRHGCEARP